MKERERESQRHTQHEKEGERGGERTNGTNKHTHTHTENRTAVIQRKRESGTGDREIKPVSYTHTHIECGREGREVG
jgi:hypothetical protein